MFQLTINQIRRTSCYVSLKLLKPYINTDPSCHGGSLPTHKLGRSINHFEFDGTPALICAISHGLWSYKFQLEENGIKSRGVVVDVETEESPLGERRGNLTRRPCSSVYIEEET